MSIKFDQEELIELIKGAITARGEEVFDLFVDVGVQLLGDVNLVVTPK
jgi:hypothetical protein